MVVGVAGGVIRSVTCVSSQDISIIQLWTNMMRGSVTECVLSPSPAPYSGDQA